MRVKNRHIRAFIVACILFLIGGTAYVCIELLYRGRSHISMFLLGGLCFNVVGYMNENFDWCVLSQSVIGSLCITLLEFISGYILNVKLRLNIWDYSNMPYNIHGQVCLLFSLYWFFLSVPCIFLNDLLLVKFGIRNKMPRYRYL